VTFLLDLSNSMKGAALTNAKKLVLLSLQLLPATWSFNIVVFGTGTVSVNGKSRSLMFLQPRAGCSKPLLN